MCGLFDGLFQLVRLFFQRLNVLLEWADSLFGACGERKEGFFQKKERLFFDEASFSWRAVFEQGQLATLLGKEEALQSVVFDLFDWCKEKQRRFLYVCLDPDSLVFNSDALGLKDCLVSCPHSPTESVEMLCFFLQEDAFDVILFDSVLRWIPPSECSASWGSPSASWLRRRWVDDAMRRIFTFLCDSSTSLLMLHPALSSEQSLYERVSYGGSVLSCFSSTEIVVLKEWL